VSAAEERIRSRFATFVAAGWLGIVGLLTFVFPASNRYAGRVVSISETAQVVVLKDGRPQSLRLAEVEFPAKGQPHARLTRAYANRLAIGNEVSVEESRLADGRRVAYLTLQGGANLGAELVKAGLAWPSARNAGRQAGSLAALEMRAMSDGRGLWGEARAKLSTQAARASRQTVAGADAGLVRGDDSEGGDADETADDAPAVETGAATLSEN
jgi:micrococcal nuclease